MATYKGIKGFEVQSLASDPTTASSVGQLYYNTTGSVFKYGTVGVGAWASGGALNTARTGVTGFGRTQSTAVAAGGTAPGGISNATEKYDGTSWANSGNLSAAKETAASFGTSTAGVIAGGNVPPYTAVVETFNGSVWSTSPATMNTARNLIKGAGLSTAGLVAGGGTTPGYVTNTESFNGSSFANVTGTNTARANYGMASQGTPTAGLVWGGGVAPTGQTVNTESYNGSAWTEVAGNLNTSREGFANAGTQTSAIGGGGSNPGGNVTNTESWDGTSWSEVGEMATARTLMGSGGLGSGSMTGFGGAAPSHSALTEEWTLPDIVIKTVATS